MFIRHLPFTATYGDLYDFNYAHTPSVSGSTITLDGELR